MGGEAFPLVERIRLPIGVDGVKELDVSGARGVVITKEIKEE